MLTLSHDAKKITSDTDIITAIDHKCYYVFYDDVRFIT